MPRLRYVLVPLIAGAAAALAACSAPASPPSTPSAPSASSDAGAAASPASVPPVSTTAARTLTFTTSAGPITVTLDPGAPRTIASMAALASKGYFHGTRCHRLTTQGIFVLQCGDPTGTGTGGPGYTIPDENLPSTSAGVYRAGTVAMANSGPDTNGSQFFIVYQDSPLPPSYTVWGTVTSGLPAVRKVAAAGVAGGGADGAPAIPVTITSVTVY